MSERAIWEAVAAGDVAARNLVVEQHIPLVRYIVGRMHLSLPASLDFEDIVGFGTLGLIEAVERYDYLRGVAFSTFAIQRILNARLDRDPNLSELAQALELTEDEVSTILAEADATMTSSLDEPNHWGEDAATVGDLVHSTDASIEERAEMGENLSLVATGLEQLDRNEKTLMALYYFEGLNFTEIGDLIGVTESRACQIHVSAMRSLREVAVT